MTGDRWERIQELFHQTADLPPGERLSFLKSTCNSDSDLISEVLAMVEEDTHGSLLDDGIAQVADRMLDRELELKNVGRYRIKKLLGEGGMGVVYLGERDDLGSVVAIKILRDAWLSPARRDRFASEQRMLAQLNHPSIARLYDADTLPDGTPWIVMEYVEGLPLTEYCKEQNCSVEERLRLFREVCEAVRHAHLHAVIHRDLKPSNILVRPDGGVRLLDFGIAKQLDRLESPAEQTRTTFRMMTPAYAAPEQIRGERVGVYTDVYSLGVILYELLAGRLPFDLLNLTLGEAESIITQRSPEKPTKNADLDVLCLTAMHKDPVRRYSSAEALIRDVDHYLKGEPLDARPDSLGYRAGKFVRRYRSAVTAAVVVFALLVGLITFFTVRLAIARNAALAEAARTRRIQRFMLDLFDGGDKQAGPADNLRVLSLLDRGVLDARSLNGEPAVQAELYQTLGSIYQKLGKLDKADSLLNAAFERRKSIFGNDSAEVAQSLVALGLLRIDQEQLSEAERLVRDGLSMTKRHAAPLDPAVAKATTSLGRVLEERGAYDQAIPVLDEAVRVAAAQGPVSADLAASLNELASVHFYAGRYQNADTLFRRVLEMHRTLLGERHPSIADDLINLGAVQQDLGYFAETEKLNRQALEINRAYFGDDHPQTAHNLTTLGRVLVSENRMDEGTDLLRQALAIEERAYGTVNRYVASTLNDLGKAALQQNKLDDAEARFSRMVEIYRAIYKDRHYLIGIALSNLASVFVEKHEYPHAEKLYGDAIQMFRDTLPGNHVSTAIAEIKLGKVLVREHRYREAETSLLAGYDVLMKQANPSVSYLQTARTELVTVYNELHEPEKAAPYRAQAPKTP
jgi:serine/threonine-protein kinase